MQRRGTKSFLTALQFPSKYQVSIICIMTMTFHSYKRNDSALNFSYRPSRLTEKYCKRLYLEQLIEAKLNQESTNLTFPRIDIAIWHYDSYYAILAVYRYLN